MRLISHYFIGFFLSVNRARLNLTVLIAAMIWASGCQAGSPLHFSPEMMIEWPVKKFEGATLYTLEPMQERKVIRARSEAAASGLFYEREIDLTKTPYLSWRWKVTKLPELENEKVKSGDDFAARVYIVVNDGWTFLSTKAISYVWSAETPAGETWSNPFTGDSAMMVSVRQQAAGSGWFTEKRNLKADLKRFFGKDIDTVKAVAIMTDTDNSQSAAEAWYGGITFSAH